MTDRDIIDQLIAVRNQRGLLQRDVAARMHVSVSTVAHFERRGRDASPTLATLLRYARAVDAKILIEAVTQCP